LAFRYGEPPAEPTLRRAAAEGAIAGPW
jgi:hypothetical protein